MSFILWISLILASFRGETAVPSSAIVNNATVATSEVRKNLRPCNCSVEPPITRETGGPRETPKPLYRASE